MTKKNSLDLGEADELEMEEFRKVLVNNIETVEVNDRIFSKWQFKFDNSREHVI